MLRLRRSRVGELGGVEGFLRSITGEDGGVEGQAVRRPASSSVGVALPLPLPVVDCGRGEEEGVESKSRALGRYKEIDSAIGVNSSASLAEAAAGA